ncbi:MAG TPA: CDP-diacylglycerol--glycerol-3-phosphate 3-phosphatidyltransferase [Candidatus Hydrogenedentes bacterium]|nr:CDP-diacylglycerol--glycerol-3-phosphate 3-phosphatidyltransferase [Candidatus Hydrogenedentota bacterium]
MADRRTIGAAAASGTSMTLANRITIGRLVLIPVFIVLVMTYTKDQQWLRYAALAVFAAAAISDAVDGFIARAYNQKTKLGAVLDPLADKLLINLALVFLAVNNHLATPIPPWFPVLILGRDVIIVIGAYLINEYFGPVRARPQISGKLTTLLQMVLIFAVLLELPSRFIYGTLYVTLFVAVFSFADYLRAGIKQVGNEDQA